MTIIVERDQGTRVIVVDKIVKKKIIMIERNIEIMVMITIKITLITEAGVGQIKKIKAAIILQDTGIKVK